MTLAEVRPRRLALGLSTEQFLAEVLRTLDAHGIALPAYTSNRVQRWEQGQGEAPALLLLKLTLDRLEAARQ